MGDLHNTSRPRWFVTPLLLCFIGVSAIWPIEDGETNTSDRERSGSVDPFRMSKEFESVLTEPNSRINYTKPKVRS